MSYTWRDIKLATEQKMYAANGSEIVDDESTKDYLAGMPYAANEGLQRNDGKSFTFSADGVKSFYFQYSGIGTVTIERENLTTSLTLDSYGKFTEYKGNYDNDANERVTITFQSDYPATVKNIALYDTYFPEDSLVPEYGRYVKYDLKTLASDFYNLFDNSISYEDGNVYLNTTDYYRESDHILILPSNKPGSYTIWYHAYPEQITEETEDDYVLPIDPDVAVLLPLYMASQLYMDDDLAIATTLRNQFEVGLESLVNTSHYSGKEKFTSEWV